jgi:uncharacterized membrane protein
MTVHASSTRWLALPALAVSATALCAQVPPAPPSSVVHAVLFYSPSCPHCHKVMTEDLPPLFARYGPRLRIAGVDVSTANGQAMYRAAVRAFAVPADRLGVPTLIVGSRVLVGDGEIPAEFPGIVERGFAAGGIEWPDFPELRQALARAGETVAHAGDTARAAPPAPAETVAAAPVPAHADTQQAGPRDTSAPAPAPRAVPAAPRRHRAPPPAAPPPRAAPAPAPAPTGRDSLAPGVVGALTPLAGAGRGSSRAAHAVWDRFLRDPAGNTAAVVVMLAMVASLIWVAAAALGRARPLPPVPTWVVPTLAVLGLGVASYLAFVEVSGTRAVCGPLGDCNTVQQSPYARLFGVLPVGVAGVAGYAAIAAVHFLGTLGRGTAGRVGRLALWSFALVATLFSVYLTFLEPFVIGATCSWCLSSAVISTLLLVAATPRALPDLRALLPDIASRTP